MATRRDPKQVGCCGGFLLIGLATLALLAISSPRAPRAPAGATSAPARPAPARPALAPGDEGILMVPGAQSVFIATADDAWDEMLDAENAGDMKRMFGLMDAGKVLRVPNGIRVRVLRNAVLSRKVRIIDEDDADFGREGWVQEGFTRPAG